MPFPVHLRRTLFLLVLLLGVAPLGAVDQPASVPSPAAPDVLVYPNGDRLQGRLLSNDGTLIVFQSVRFGVLRASATEVRVLPAAASSPTPPAAASAEPAKVPETAEAKEQRLSIERLALAARRLFGPWHGRLSISAEIIDDTAERRSDVVEAKMERKWTGDQVRLETRYEFSETQDVTSSDVYKGNVYWRHDLTRRYFTVYHPAVEWNRNYYDNGTPSDYLLLQQEFGAGIVLLNTDRRKLRVGLSGNDYDLWNLTARHHLTRFMESAFIEAEVRLPWKANLTERGIRYFSIAGGETGWESQFELNKKLTETLVLALHYDVRHRNPDIRVQDYAAWRLLLGFDF